MPYQAFIAFFVSLLTSVFLFLAIMIRMQSGDVLYCVNRGAAKTAVLSFNIMLFIIEGKLLLHTKFVCITRNKYVA